MVLRLCYKNQQKCVGYNAKMPEELVLCKQFARSGFARQGRAIVMGCGSPPKEGQAGAVCYNRGSASMITQLVQTFLEKGQPCRPEQHEETKKLGELAPAAWQGFSRLR